MFRNYTILLLIGLFFASCSDRDDKHLGDIALDLNISVYNRPRISKQAFSNGDQIGLYLVDYIDGNPGILGNVFSTRYMNVMYTLNGNYWYANDEQEIFVNENYSDLYTYYPYDPEISKTPDKMNLSAYPFSIQTEQDELSFKNDFLWAKISMLSAADPRVNAVFRHLMSRFEINLKYEDPDKIPADPQLKIYNTQTSSLINLRTGVASPTGKANIILPYKSIRTNEGFDFTYEAIIIPQLIPEGTPLFSITTNNETLIYETKREITIASQNIYTFNMTVPTPTNQL